MHHCTPNLFTTFVSGIWYYFYQLVFQHMISTFPVWYTTDFCNLWFCSSTSPLSHSMMYMLDFFFSLLLPIPRTDMWSFCVKQIYIFYISAVLLHNRRKERLCLELKTEEVFPVKRYGPAPKVLTSVHLQIWVNVEKFITYALVPWWNFNFFKLPVFNSRHNFLFVFSKMFLYFIFFGGGY